MNSLVKLHRLFSDNQPRTKYTISEEIGVSPTHASRLLKKLHTKNQIYILSWNSETKLPVYIAKTNNDQRDAPYKVKRYRPNRIKAHQQYRKPKPEFKKVESLVIETMIPMIDLPKVTYGLWGV